MTTAPEAGNPSSPLTVMVKVVSVCPPRSWVSAVIVVCVATPRALSADTAVAGIATAIPNAATNSSRRPRLNILLTCTCSRFEEKIVYRPVWQRLLIVSVGAMAGPTLPQIGRGMVIGRTPGPKASLSGFRAPAPILPEAAVRGSHPGPVAQES